MGQTPKPDTLSPLDPILADADTEKSPWQDDPEDPSIRQYIPDRDTLRKLLAVPIELGYATKQQSGRVAKSLDVYVAHELRRAGFPESMVFPRPRQPRVLAGEMAKVEQNIDLVLSLLKTHETETGEKLKPPVLRRAITRLPNALPGSRDATILGRFYGKQVDVVVSDWRRGPDVLVSGKTMFSSFGNNKNNRYEEAIGEANNLRDRYPLAALGFAYVVRDNVFKGGTYELLRDLLIRLRKPDGPFDATVLLVASWGGGTSVQNRTASSQSGEDENVDPSKTVEPIIFQDVKDPAPTLALPKFFEDLLDAVMTYTPVDFHKEVRMRQLGEPAVADLPATTDAAPDLQHGLDD